MILSVDVGSSNLKAGLFSPQGRLLRLARRPMRLHSDATGAAEHDPEAVHASLLSALREAAAGRGGQVKALVLGSYNMGLLALDRQGRPLGRLLTLLDTRAKDDYPALLSRIPAAELYRRTACPPLDCFPLARLWWWKRRRKPLYRRAWRFVGIKEYLGLRLTGRLATDCSSASTTQLLNARSGNWDAGLLKLLGIDAGRLPEVMAPEDQVGGLKAGAARSLGLPVGIPVLAGLYDACALACALGGAALNFGTTAMLRAPSSKPVFDPAMRLQSAWLGGDRWLVGGGVNNAGFAAQWAATSLLGRPLRLLEREAEAAGPGAGGVCALPLLSGERIPALAAKKGALLAGLLPGHGQGHVYRAIIEGSVFLLRGLKESLAAVGLRTAPLSLGGAATASPFLRRLLCDALDAPLRPAKVEEPALQGNAALAAKALGWARPSPPAFQATLRPRPGQVRSYARAYRRFQELLQAHQDGP